MGTISKFGKYLLCKIVINIRVSSISGFWLSICCTDNINESTYN